MDRDPVGDGPPGPLSDPAFVAGLRPIPSGPVHGDDRSPAHDLAGVDPSGVPVVVSLADRGRPVLVVFLHTRCDGCHGFWRGLGDGAPGGGELGWAPLVGGADPVGPPVAGSGGGPGGPWWSSVDPVIVTRSPGTVDAGEVAALATGVTRVPVVMSDRAWTDYRVTGYPFFVLVDPVERMVIGETVGFGWPDVAAMVRSTLDPQD